MKVCVLIFLGTPEGTHIHPLLVSWWHFSQVFTVVSSQCYRELGKNPEAKRWMKLALELPNVTKEVILKTFTNTGILH